MSTAQVTIRLSNVLAQMTGGERKFCARGLTVGDALKDFVSDQKAMAKHIYDESGAVRKYIVVVHRDEYVRGWRALDRELSNNDEIFIVTAVTGG